MRLPDLRNVVVNGVAFPDLGGKAQERYIGGILDDHKARLAETDPGDGARTATDAHRDQSRAAGDRWRPLVATPRSRAGCSG